VLLIRVADSVDPPHGGWSGTRVVSVILGHSPIDITMDVYGHVLQHTQRESTSHMDRLLGNTSSANDRPR
jgi:integrase